MWVLKNKKAAGLDEFTVDMIKNGDNLVSNCLRDYAIEYLIMK